MKAFIYNGDTYIRLIPSKAMFKSTLVHEVVNRGDIFAFRVSDGQFTVIPGLSQVQHIEVNILQTADFVRGAGYVAL